MKRKMMVVSIIETEINVPDYDLSSVELNSLMQTEASKLFTKPQDTNILSVQSCHLDNELSDFLKKKVFEVMRKVNGVTFRVQAEVLYGNLTHRIDEYYTFSEEYIDSTSTDDFIDNIKSKISSTYFVPSMVIFESLTVEEKME